MSALSIGQETSISEEEIIFPTAPETTARQN
jgi:hypothetical protein